MCIGLGIMMGFVLFCWSLILVCGVWLYNSGEYLVLCNSVVIVVLMVLGLIRVMFVVMFVEMS